jgi:hypothetical protein
MCSQFHPIQMNLPILFYFFFLSFFLQHPEKCKIKNIYETKFFCEYVFEYVCLLALWYQFEEQGRIKKGVEEHMNQKKCQRRGTHQLTKEQEQKPTKNQNAQNLSKRDIYIYIH